VIYKDAEVTALPQEGRFWAYVKLAVGLALVAAVLIFTAQNADIVRVHFLGGLLELSLALLIFLVLAVGMLAGYLMGGWLRWKKKRKRSQ
jgi:uncharacterized integral membrane protein